MLDYNSDVESNSECNLSDCDEIVFLSDEFQGADGFEIVDGDELIQERCVAGYYCDESEIEFAPSRDGYTNLEVDEHLSTYFNFFGKKDMDINYLYFLSKKRQFDIQKILGKTQPAVSYDVKRIKQQMDFVVKMAASIDDFILFITGNPSGLTTCDKEILTVFFYTTSIIKTARVLKMEDKCIRSILSTCVKKLKRNGHIEMYDLFVYILGNLNNVKKYVARCDETPR